MTSSLTGRNDDAQNDEEMSPKEMVAYAFIELQKECAIQQKVIWIQTSIILILSGLTFAQFKGIFP